MPDSPNTLRLALVARCAELLAELHADTVGVVSATATTADGFAVASTLTTREESDKLAAMASSTSALAAAFARETGRGTPERVIVESDGGYNLALRVPGGPMELVLTVVADRDAVLGTLLWNCRATADKLARSLLETAPSPT